ncbi:MAG TPA: hypothetical protein VEK57_20570 [Thermoanaerobaculia bacterium]|nr:hypothetical protein [Thermoanaerobaculia bacterium]
MPRWIPVLIGLVLVAIAGLAVFTGLRNRDDGTMAEHVRPRTDRRANTPAPPGEPGAGASLVLHGESGENVPAANEPVEGQARTVISGGPGGIETTSRLWARRGMVLNVLPPDTTVYVNDLPIGEVTQFNTVDEVYDFAEPGSYTIKLVAPNGASKTFIVTASDDAKVDVARISTKL